MSRFLAPFCRWLTKITPLVEDKKLKLDQLLRWSDEGELMFHEDVARHKTFSICVVPKGQRSSRKNLLTQIEEYPKLELMCGSKSWFVTIYSAVELKLN